mmetsp:Transcript_14700/g.21592  ORF Transcript_14700/g.21592 Transcript_14700/m.21592 type:complete len:97 (+) Transcript_14700:190-480(+)
MQRQRDGAMPPTSNQVKEDSDKKMEDEDIQCVGVRNKNAREEQKESTGAASSGAKKAVTYANAVMGLPQTKLKMYTPHMDYASGTLLPLIWTMRMR